MQKIIQTPMTFDADENCAKQSFKDECDINKIMAKFQKTGVLNHYAKHAPSYQDIPALEYSDALNIIATADTMFEELPSETRKQFDNDPEKFLEFVNNPENLEEMREMGLAKPGQHLPQAPQSTQSNESGGGKGKEPEAKKVPKTSASEE